MPALQFNKILWQVPSGRLAPGHVIHTLDAPLVTDVYNSRTRHVKKLPLHLHGAYTTICNDRSTTEFDDPVYSRMGFVRRKSARGHSRSAGFELSTHDILV